MAEFTQSQIEDLFTFHPPNDEQRHAYEQIREAAKKFAVVLLMYTPTSPDQTVAVRKLREVVMTANASIALGGRF